MYFKDNWNHVAKWGAIIKYKHHAVIPGAALAVRLVQFGPDHFLYFSHFKYVTYYQAITFQKPEQQCCM